MRSKILNKLGRSGMAASAAVALLASPSIYAQGQGDAPQMPEAEDHIESKGIGEWADLSIEEHVLKAVIEGASRGPADDEVTAVFQQKTRSAEPVEIRAERQHEIKDRPGCAVVNLYFHQERVPMYQPDDSNFDKPVKHVPFEVRYEMERCADGDSPKPRFSE